MYKLSFLSSLFIAGVISINLFAASEIKFEAMPKKFEYVYNEDLTYLKLEDLFLKGYSILVTAKSTANRLIIPAGKESVQVAKSIVSKKDYFPIDIRCNLNLKEASSSDLGLQRDVELSEINSGMVASVNDRTFKGLSFEVDDPYKIIDYVELSRCIEDKQGILTNEQQAKAKCEKILEQQQEIASGLRDKYVFMKNIHVIDIIRACNNGLNVQIILNTEFNNLQRASKDQSDDRFFENEKCSTEACVQDDNVEA